MVNKHRKHRAHQLNTHKTYYLKARNASSYLWKYGVLAIAELEKNTHEDCVHRYLITTTPKKMDI